MPSEQNIVKFQQVEEAVCGLFLIVAVHSLIFWTLFLSNGQIADLHLFVPHFKSDYIGLDKHMRFKQSL